MAEGLGAPPGPAPAASTAKSRSAGTVVLAVLAAVLFASTVLLAVVAADLKADKDELADGRRDVAEVAGRFVEALLSYDHEDPEGFRSRVLELTAPPFSEQFREAVDALEADFELTESVSVPSIEDVFVAEVEADTATAIVVYDRVLDGTAGRRTESNLYVRLGMIRQGGEWLVNDVLNLNLALADAPMDTSTSTSTTGAPAG